MALRYRHRLAKLQEYGELAQLTVFSLQLSPFPVQLRGELAQLTVFLGQLSPFLVQLRGELAERTVFFLQLSPFPVQLRGELAQLTVFLGQLSPFPVRLRGELAQLTVFLLQLSPFPVELKSELAQITAFLGRLRPFSVQLRGELAQSPYFSAGSVHSRSSSEVSGVAPVSWTQWLFRVRKESRMPRGQRIYPAEYRRQLVELVRAGRGPEELSREFGPTSRSIRNWVQQADVDEGRGGGGLTTAEREELRRLRRENRQLRQEREILAKAAAWFARETESVPPKDSDS